MLYKAWLVAQDFSQRLIINYEETYSSIMDIITFRFLIGLAVSKTLDMHLIDVVVVYLYGLLDKDIHVKIFEGFIMSKAFCNELKHIYSIKLQKHLYGLK